MTRFAIGEEVLYDGERFVVGGWSDEPPHLLRLLATSRQGARFVWAREEEITRIAEYTESHPD